MSSTVSHVRLRDLFSRVSRAIGTAEGVRRPGRTSAGRQPHPDPTASPGEFGRSATRQISHPRRVRLAYAPDLDGDPDPGEVVWTWVPYEDDPSRGKDRPVLLVARTPGGLLGLQLSSKDHDEHLEWLPLGVGAWDHEMRPSWVRLDRMLLVHPDGMRREGATLDRQRFDTVAIELRKRYGWR